MKCVVVYESMFGNSEKVARAVAEGVASYAESEARDVTDLPPGMVPDDVGLLVVGGPTHALSMSRPATREDAVRQGARQGVVGRGLREWLDALPSDLERLPFAAFDTRVSRVRRLPGSAARAAARVLHRHRGRIVVAPESFYVSDVAGPLAEAELDRAREWGSQLGATAQGRSVQTDA